MNSNYVVATIQQAKEEESASSSSDASSGTQWLKRSVMTLSVGSVLVGMCHIYWAQQRMMALEKLCTEVTGIDKDLADLEAASQLSEAKQMLQKVIDSITDPAKTTVNQGILNACQANLINLNIGLASLLGKVNEVKTKAEQQQQHARDVATTTGAMKLVGVGLACLSPLTGIGVIGLGFYLNSGAYNIEIKNLETVTDILSACHSMEDELEGCQHETLKLMDEVSEVQRRLMPSESSIPLPPRLQKLDRTS